MIVIFLPHRECTVLKGNASIYFNKISVTVATTLRLSHYCDSITVYADTVTTMIL